MQSSDKVILFGWQGSSQRGGGESGSKAWSSTAGASALNGSQSGKIGLSISGLCSTYWWSLGSALASAGVHAGVSALVSFSSLEITNL